MAALLLSPVADGVSRADIINVVGKVGDVVVATGSFQTDGTCARCADAAGLESFSLTLQGHVLEPDSLAYRRDTNDLLGSFQSDGYHLVFTPSGHLQFSAPGS